jgi:hypothetical protein
VPLRPLNRDLKNRRSQGREGSTPSPGTTRDDSRRHAPLVRARPLSLTARRCQSIGLPAGLFWDDSVRKGGHWLDSSPGDDHGDPMRRQAGLVAVFVLTAASCGGSAGSSSSTAAPGATQRSDAPGASTPLNPNLPSLPMGTKPVGLPVAVALAAPAQPCDTAPQPPAATRLAVARDYLDVHLTVVAETVRPKSPQRMRTPGCHTTTSPVRRTAASSSSWRTGHPTCRPPCRPVAYRTPLPILRGQRRQTVRISLRCTRTFWPGYSRGARIAWSVGVR